jgi:hydrogenase maturation protease
VNQGEASSEQRPVLVIGYGNPLRGDDSVGQQLAREVAAWQIPGLRILEIHQLTPELAEPLAGARLAIFVDAYAARAGEPVKVESLEPAKTASVLAHYSDPCDLLALAQAIYRRHPLAWWVKVPATNFEAVEKLSPTAANGSKEALDRLADLVREGYKQHNS